MYSAFLPVSDQLKLRELPHQPMKSLDRHSCTVSDQLKLRELPQDPTIKHRMESDSLSVTS